MGNKKELNALINYFLFSLTVFSVKYLKGLNPSAIFTIN
jgi:hypothetical protein